MRGKGQFVWLFILFTFCSFIPQISHAVEYKHVNARSAILCDMTSGKVLYEQDADTLIPPASLTKILTLYLTFQAIESGQISLSDKVRVSKRAASMPKVRMGLRRGDIVTVAQLIHGMAIESGNDAAVAMAEHISGSVESFVARMNVKARQLGMTNSRFMTPNGLPAAGQFTTARDILKLSTAYIGRFPQALAISSIRSYTYKGKTDHNPNNLLGRCPGVDGLKTGFVCASGFNISATAMRDHKRIIAVVLGATNPGIRCIDAENLIEEGYSEIGGPCYARKDYPHPVATASAKVARGAKSRRVRRAAHARRAKLAACPGSHHPKRRLARKIPTAHAPRIAHSRVSSKKTGPRSLARARRKAPKVALRQRKAALALARAQKNAAGHRKISSRAVSKRKKLAKTASRKKTLCANSTKCSAKARRASNKKKVLAHRRTRVKTAIKKRHRGASHAREENRPIG